MISLGGHPKNLYLIYCANLFDLILSLNNKKKELPGLKTAMILVAKCSITLSFNSIYTLTSEFYPTDIRNTLIATCVSFGKLGSCLVPFVYLYVSNLARSF